jgi:hypothetical protein
VNAWAVDRCQSADAGVWSMVIVVVHPLLVCGRAGVIGQVGVGVGPFGGQRAVEAFDAPMFVKRLWGALLSVVLRLPVGLEDWRRFRGRCSALGSG